MDQTDRSQKVATARAYLGVTQEQIADGCGLARNTVWRYETGGLAVSDWYLTALVGYAFNIKGADAAGEVRRILDVPASEVPA